MGDVAEVASDRRSVHLLANIRFNEDFVRSLRGISKIALVRAVALPLSINLKTALPHGAARTQKDDKLPWDQCVCGGLFFAHRVTFLL